MDILSTMLSFLKRHTTIANPSRARLPTANLELPQRLVQRSVRVT
jgi:hypothetical protein